MLTVSNYVLAGHDKDDNDCVQKCKDVYHGAQVVRAMLWCEDEVEVSVLLKHSCLYFATAQDCNGITPLHVAALRGWHEVINWLLRYGADVNARDGIHDSTALHYVARNCDLHTLLLLIKNNGNFRQVNDRGWDALHYINQKYFSDLECFCKSDKKSTNVSVPTPAFGLISHLVDDEVPQRKPAKFFYHPKVHKKQQWTKSVKEHQLQLRRLVSTKQYRLNEDCSDSDTDQDFSARLYAYQCISESKSCIPPSINKTTTTFVFGENNNYNLGLGSAHRYVRPTILEALARDHIVQVGMSKYHSLYLTGTGAVKACGHGTGGRLGTGQEATCVRPETVSLPTGTRVVMVAAGTDHSLFLTDQNEVFACGLNQYRQLGVSGADPNERVLTPRRIAYEHTPTLRNGLTSTGVLGVACSRYHSVLWTEQGLYTWGTNLGQLGHTDDIVATPRRVTSCKRLNSSSGITMVSVCDTATVMATCDGAVLCFYRHGSTTLTSSLAHESDALLRLVCRGGPPPQHTEVLRTFNQASNVSQEVVDGVGSCGVAGVLNELCGKVEPKGRHFVAQQRDDLTVAILTKGHIVYLWRESRPTFGRWRLSHENFMIMLVMDIVLLETSLLVVTNAGEVLRVVLYEGVHRDFDRHSFKAVPHLHKALRVFSDPKGLNVAVLTTDVLQEEQMTELKPVRSVYEDLSALHDEASLDDDIHDVQLECHGVRYPAHRIVLAAKSAYFRSLFCLDTDTYEERHGGTGEGNRCQCGAVRPFDHLPPVDVTSAPDQEVVKVDFVAPEFLEEVLSYLYAGHCKRILYPNYKLNSSVPRMSKCTGDDEDSDGSPDERAFAIKMENKKCLSELDPLIFGNFDSKEKFYKYVNGVAKAAHLLQVMDFFSNSCIEPTIVLSRCCLVIPDVQFEASDGSRGPTAHRAVLAARAAYFGVLLASRWAQSSTYSDGCRVIRSSYCHSQALLLLLQYCYTGDCCTCSLALSVAQDLLALSDEMLCPGAHQWAQREVARHVTSRNMLALLQFAGRHNAHHLHEDILRYATHNLSLLIENRILEQLSPLDLAKVLELFNSVGEKGMYEVDNRGHLDNPRTPRPDACYFLPRCGTGQRVNISRFKDKIFTSSSEPLYFCRLESLYGIYPFEVDPMVFMQLRLPRVYRSLMGKKGAAEAELLHGKPPPTTGEGPPCPPYPVCVPGRKRRSSRRSSSESSESELLPTYDPNIGSLFCDFQEVADRSWNVAEADEEWQTVKRKSGSAWPWTAGDSPPQPVTSAAPSAVRADPIIVSYRPPLMTSTTSVTAPVCSTSVTPAHNKPDTSPGVSAAAALPVGAAAAAAVAPVAAAAAPVGAAAAPVAVISTAAAHSSDAGITEGATSAAECGDTLLKKPSLFQDSAEFPSLSESVAEARTQPRFTADRPPPPRLSQKQRREQQRLRNAASATEPVQRTPAWGTADSSGTGTSGSYTAADMSSSVPDAAVALPLASAGEARSPPQSSAFSQIMQQEQDLNERLRKNMKKSLDDIQVEELAMAQLLQHYRALAGPGDTVTVERICNLEQPRPAWTARQVAM